MCRERKGNPECDKMRTDDRSSSNLPLDPGSSVKWVPIQTRRVRIGRLVQFQSILSASCSLKTIRRWVMARGLFYKLLLSVHPPPVLLPGKSHWWRSLVGCSPGGRWELDTIQWLPFHFSLSCIGEGNGNPLQCSCLENPRDGRAWWAAIYGVAQSRTWLKWLSSSSSSSWVCRHLKTPWPFYFSSTTLSKLWCREHFSRESL